MKTMILPSYSDSGLQIRPTLDGEGFLTTVTHLPAGRLFNEVMKFLTIESGKKINWDTLELIEKKYWRENKLQLDTFQINLDQSNFPPMAHYKNSVVQ
jgi:hypothetical protein